MRAPKALSWQSSRRHYPADSGEERSTGQRLVSESVSTSEYTAEGGRFFRSVADLDARPAVMVELGRSIFQKVELLNASTS